MVDPTVFDISKIPLGIILVVLGICVLLIACGVRVKSTFFGLISFFTNSNPKDEKGV